MNAAAEILAVVERPLSLVERAWNKAWLRRGAILLLLTVVWEVSAQRAGNPLMFPAFSAVARAFADGVLRGTLPDKALVSLQVLLAGYGLGALLALLWFGLGTPSLLFVLVHAVVWPMALSASSGFASVAQTLRMAGRNYGLSGPRYVLLILVPAAFPAILAGLKVGWAFAWRTLIAAELVFGVASGSGGLGWFIFENKNRLETDAVFAGLGTVILIGLAVEGLVFRALERHTIRKWGMHS